MGMSYFNDVNVEIKEIVFRFTLFLLFAADISGQNCLAAGRAS